MVSLDGRLLWQQQFAKLNQQLGTGKELKENTLGLGGRVNSWANSSLRILHLLECRTAKCRQDDGANA